MSVFSHVHMTLLMIVASGCAPKSSLEDSGSRDRHPAYGVSVDTGGNWSSGSKSRTEMSFGSGDGRREAAAGARSEGGSTVFEWVSNLFDGGEAKKGPARVRARKPVTFNSEGRRNGNAVVHSSRSGQTETTSKTYPSLHEARQSFENQQSSLLVRVNSTSKDLNSAPDSWTPGVNSAAVSHNQQVNVLVSGFDLSYPDTLDAQYVTDPGSTEGQSIRRTAAYLRHAKKKRDSMAAEQAQALDLAAEALARADQAIGFGQRGQGQMFREVAVQLIDFALGVIPGVGFAKDFYEAYTGKSVLTGAELSEIERSFAIIGVATAGIGSQVLTVGKTVKNLAVILKNAPGSATARGALDNAMNIARGADGYGIKTQAGLRVYAKIHGSIETLPSGIKVRRIREGSDPTKIAIIGRSMGDVKAKKVGVNDMKAHLERNGVEVETFEPSVNARGSFRKMANDFRKQTGSKTSLPNSLVVGSEIYTENKAWVNKLVDDGYTVIDLGDPNGLNAFSPFYGMEKMELFAKKGGG